MYLLFDYFEGYELSVYVYERNKENKGLHLFHVAEILAA
jgi:hypothetical protein